MNPSELINDIVATYQKHGWQLRRVLLRPATLAEIDETLFPELDTTEAEFDALWFSRASHGQREAWELRLVAETQYALFETFEKDEAEEAREEVRKEMEARMRERTVMGDEAGDG